MRILLVEDDAALSDAIRVGLSFLGYDVIVAPDGLRAEAELLNAPFAVIVLDLGLPRLGGLDLLRRQREAENRTPVIVLTARDTVDQKVKALDLGADDYLVKPVVLEELAARVRAQIRRHSGLSRDRIVHGELSVDVGSRTVTRNGAVISLTPREFAVLLALLEGAGRVQSRDRLERALYGWTAGVESNSLEVHVHHLRRKLGDELIRTVRGAGYMIARPDAE